MTAMKEGLAARLCALNALNGVFFTHKPLDDALAAQAAKCELSREDQAFAMAVCGMVLRYKDSLQKIVNKAGNRTRPFAPDHLNTLLLIGAAQILLMGTPDHAAVDTAVRLAGTIKCAKQKNLVNAVLRRIAREKKTDGLQPALPDWLKRTWIDDYGPETARSIEQASLQEAPLDIIGKPAAAQKYFAAFSGAISLRENHIRLPEPPKPVAALPGYEDGAWWVQDFASSLPVHLLGDIAGRQVLDLCAAPGGKTMQLAAMGARVTAVDISEKRLKRLHDNLGRTKTADKVGVICADILKWRPPSAGPSEFDIVLLDAPCSATGTIRRHPDLPFIRKAGNIRTLAGLQAQLLDHVKTMVRPGGTLVYCTCSLQKDEGERQIARFLAENDDFGRRAIAGYEDWQTSDGDIRLLPFYKSEQGGMDGFFISLLERK